MEARERDGSVHPPEVGLRIRRRVFAVHHPSRSSWDSVKNRLRVGNLPDQDGPGMDLGRWIPDAPHSELSAFDALHDLFGDFERHLADPDPDTLEGLSRTIPSVMASFAQELSVDDAFASDIAGFASKYRLEIAKLINRQLRQGPAGPGVQAKAAPVGISIEDDILWGIAGTSMLSASRSTSMASRSTSITVCEWILSSFLRAGFLYFPHEGVPDSILAFRKLVTEKLVRQGLPGTLNQSLVARATFHLPRASAEVLKEDLAGNVSGLSAPARTLGERIVLTSSDPDRIQATTIRQYLDQTWPCGGTSIMRVFKSELQGPKYSHNVTVQIGLAGTQNGLTIHAEFTARELIVRLTGPLHLIVETAEQLAWLSGTTQPRVDPITWASSRLRLEPITPYSDWDLRRICHLNLGHLPDVLDSTNPTVRLLRQLQASESPLRSVPPIIWGFPTARRPDNEPGIELPWELLVEIVGVKGLETHQRDVLLHGREEWLRLVKETNGVLVWHMTPKVTHCSCAVYIHQTSSGHDMRSLYLDALRTFRHILAPCQGQAIPPEQGPPGAMSKAEGGCTAQEVPGSPVRPRRNNEWDCESDTIEHASSPKSSIETESLSISEDSEPEDELINPPDPADAIFPFVDPVARRLLGAYRRKKVLPRSKQPTIRTKSPGTHDETSQVPHVSACSGSSLHCRPQNSSKSLSRPEKRRGEPSRDRDSDEEGSRKRQPPKKRKPSSPAEDRRTFLLACPFWKLDPREHRSCFRFNLDGIARVKQHLTRKHAPQFYCEFCMAVLDDSESHQRHVAARTCSFRSCSFRGITHQQQRELSKRSRPNLSEAERWFTIWDIVFPGRPRPPSPYIDTTLSEDLCQFREFAHARGPAIIAAEIQANSGDGSCMISQWEQDPAALQSRVFARCFALIFDEWLAEHAADSSPPDPARQPETSAVQSDSSSTEPSGTQTDANTQNTPTSSESLGQACPVATDRGKGKGRTDEAPPQQEESSETDLIWMQEERFGQDEDSLDYKKWQYDTDFFFRSDFDDFGAAPTGELENPEDLEMDLFLGAEDQDHVHHHRRGSRNTVWNSAYI